MRCGRLYCIDGSSISLRLWPLLVALQHGGRDFRTAGPLTAPPTGVGLIVAEALGVGLDDLTGTEKQQPRAIGWHPFGERFGQVEGCPKPGHDGIRVDRF